MTFRREGANFVSLAFGQLPSPLIRYGVPTRTDPQTLQGSPSAQAPHVVQASDKPDKPLAPPKSSRRALYQLRPGCVWSFAILRTSDLRRHGLILKMKTDFKVRLPPHFELSRIANADIMCSFPISSELSTVEATSSSIQMATTYTRR